MSGPPRPTGPPRPGGSTTATETAQAAPSTQKRIERFTWTPEDIVASADDLLQELPEPQQVVAAGDRHLIAVVGPKGGKTVSSIAVKTNRCPGLPRPAGSITVVVHTDNQAHSSFRNFLVDNEVAVDPAEKIFFIGIGKAVGRYKSRVTRTDPGYSEYVKQVVLEIMHRLGQRGDVGLFVFDGYGDFCNQYGGYVAAHAVGLPSPIGLEGTQWYGRREMFEDLTAGCLNAVCDGGWAVINGPEGGLENEKSNDAAKLKKRIAKEGFAGREPPAKWVMYRENNANLSALITTEVGRDAAGNITYLAEVWEGRVSEAGLRTGNEANIAGQNVGVFTTFANKK